MSSKNQVHPGHIESVSDRLGSDHDIQQLLQQHETEETKQSFHGRAARSQRNKHLQGCISLRTFVVIAIISLILLCSIMVYLSVFIGMFISIEELSRKVVSNVEDKIVLYISQMLDKLKMVSNIGADLYNYGLLDKTQMRDYIFRQYNNSEILTGYFFATPTERYAVIELFGSLYYTSQIPPFRGMIRDKVNGDGSVVAYNYSVDPTPAEVIQQGFYNSTIKAAAKMGSKGAFGSIYYIINGSLALPYGSMLYDPVKFKQGIVSGVKGIYRCTVPLIVLSNFLQRIRVFERGYVLVTEFNSTQSVAGSINTTTYDMKSTLSIFDITDRNAGALMKKIYSTYSADKLPSNLRMESLGVNYMITTRTFTIDNLNWKLYIVVYEEDVTLTTTISIAASVGAMLVITCLALVFGLYLSHAITKPISFLRQQFELIKYMNLDGIHMPGSMFSEISQIYSNLDNTVDWLREIKSFVPENVFYQLQRLDSFHENPPNPSSEDSKTDNKAGSNEENLSSPNSNRELLTRPSASSASEAMGHESRKSDDLARGGGIFKMGLTSKECSVLYITLPQYLLQYSQDEIGHSFPKIITALSSISKIFNGNLQIVSNSEYQIVIESKRKSQKPVTCLAQECALKIEKGLGIVNTFLAQNNMQPISYCIGVATSSSLVGNLGTNAIRFFSCISQACESAKNLCFIANQLKLNVLIDERTQSECKNKFVARPVDRILVEKCVHSSAANNSPAISTIYHLIKESAVESDEWLYELQAKNENECCNDLHRVFDIFKSNISQQEFEDALSCATMKLENYLTKNPTDVASQKLLSLLGRLSSVEKAQSYHSKVNHSVVQVSL
ncbi:hypothetical protein C9374_009571 [Naegleria lovaniensis]|uniref:Guanylate cyclase domain-containing protein n=1 Tax=Naegleria lovaniensis TaxID=51637 RepID=A0AA88KRU3_NAELO|nr:uncharacterized protein C9374_009571 [Naegleria lovaniensis]KAG2392994.1 hypothetical protein C9374_009571 [Naegleria lovaniensis]